MQAISQDLGQLIPVVSVHWADIKQERPFQTTMNSGKRTFYNIKGVKTHKDKPSLWIVSDGVERVYMGNKRYTNIFENSKAPTIASDLVKCGTGGLVAGAEALLPAVWISKAEDCPKNHIGALELPDDWEKRYPVFAEEVAQFREREWNWCRMQVEDADAKHAKGLTNEIYDRHRKSAQWIGANPQEHLWINPVQINDKKTCPFCAMPIPMAAVRCPHPACGEILDQTRYDALKKQIAGHASAPAPKQAS